MVANHDPEFSAYMRRQEAEDRRDRLRKRLSELAARVSVEDLQDLADAADLFAESSPPPPGLTDRLGCPVY